MCKIRGTSGPSGLPPRRRSKYTLEEKKGIAKNKAKKRRDEETKYFNEIESHLRGSRSPYVGLPEKLVHNTSLRLTNAWKIGYQVLFDAEKNLTGHEVQRFPRKSMFQDIATDAMLLIVHRLCDVREASSSQPFVFLYATPSVQHFIHVNGCHDLIGAKFGEFCTSQDYDGVSYLELCAPLSQKEKRPYPSIRCRILLSNCKDVDGKYELAFYLLRGPLSVKCGSKASCGSALRKQLNAPCENFELHSPEFWRAMQARRQAIVRGAPRDLVLPEQLKRHRPTERATTSFTPTPTPAAMSAPISAAIFKREPLVMDSELHRGPDVATMFQPVPRPPACTGPAKMLLQEQRSGCSERREAPLPLRCGCGPSKCSDYSSVTSPYSLSEESAVLQSLTDVSMSPIDASNELLIDIDHADINAAIRLLEDDSTPPESPESADEDVVCLESLNNIDLDVAGSAAAALNQFEIDSLRQIAAAGDPGTTCPCGLTDKQQCLEILDGLAVKSEPSVVQLPPASSLVKREPFDEKPPMFGDELEDVKFTVDYQAEDMSSDQAFLMRDRCLYPELDMKDTSLTQSRQLDMKRSPTSLASLMDMQTTGALFDEKLPPSFIGDIRALPSDDLDGYCHPYESLDTPMRQTVSDASMDLNELLGITKKLSETSMHD